MGLSGKVLREKEPFDLSFEGWVGFQEVEQGEKSMVQGRSSGNGG